jgi:hypothetical protein
MILYFPPEIIVDDIAFITAILRVMTASDDFDVSKRDVTD